jgi:hypothetical protein
MTGSIYTVPRDRYCGDKVEIPGRRKSSFDTTQTYMICFRKRKMREETGAHTVRIGKFLQSADCVGKG